MEWVAVPSSRGSSQPRDWTQVSCIAGGFFTVWAIFMFVCLFALINICYLMMRYFFNYLASVWDYTESIMLNPPALLLHCWLILSIACTHSGNCQKESCQCICPGLTFPEHTFLVLPNSARYNKFEINSTSYIENSSGAILKQKH